MSGIDSEENIGSHNSTGNVRHPAGHHGHQFRTRQIGQKWPDGQGRFRLSHENTCCDVQRFCPTRSHHACHDPGKNPDDDLHNAEVIEHREEGRDKDDCRKHAEGKIAQLRSGIGQVAEHEVRTRMGITQEFCDRVSRFLKDIPACLHAQHKYRKGKLQP